MMDVLPYFGGVNLSLWSTTPPIDRSDDGSATFNNGTDIIKHHRSIIRQLTTTPTAAATTSSSSSSVSSFSSPQSHPPHPPPSLVSPRRRLLESSAPLAASTSPVASATLSATPPVASMGLTRHRHSMTPSPGATRVNGVDIESTNAALMAAKIAFLQHRDTTTTPSPSTSTSTLASNRTSPSLGGVSHRPTVPGHRRQRSHPHLRPPFPRLTYSSATSATPSPATIARHLADASDLSVLRSQRSHFQETRLKHYSSGSILTDQPALPPTPLMNPRTRLLGGQLKARSEKSSPSTRPTSFQSSPYSMPLKAPSPMHPMKLHQYTLGHDQPVPSINIMDSQQSAPQSEYEELFTLFTNDLDIFGTYLRELVDTCKASTTPVSISPNQSKPSLGDLNAPNDDDVESHLAVDKLPQSPQVSSTSSIASTNGDDTDTCSSDSSVSPPTPSIYDPTNASIVHQLFSPFTSSLLLPETYHLIRVVEFALSFLAAAPPNCLRGTHSTPSSSTPMFGPFSNAELSDWRATLRLDLAIATWSEKEWIDARQSYDGAVYLVSNCMIDISQKIQNIYSTITHILQNGIGQFSRTDTSTPITTDAPVAPIQEPLTSNDALPISSDVVVETASTDSSFNLPAVEDNPISLLIDDIICIQADLSALFHVYPLLDIQQRKARGEIISEDEIRSMIREETEPSRGSIVVHEDHMENPHDESVGHSSDSVSANALDGALEPTSTTYNHSHHEPISSMCALDDPQHTDSTLVESRETSYNDIEMSQSRVSSRSPSPVTPVADDAITASSALCDSCAHTSAPDAPTHTHVPSNLISSTTLSLVYNHSHSCICSLVSQQSTPSTLRPSTNHDHSSAIDPIQPIETIEPTNHMVKEVYGEKSQSPSPYATTPTISLQYVLLHPSRSSSKSPTDSLTGPYSNSNLPSPSSPSYMLNSSPTPSTPYIASYPCSRSSIESRRSSRLSWFARCCGSTSDQQ